MEHKKRTYGTFFCPTDAPLFIAINSSVAAIQQPSPINPPFRKEVYRLLSLLIVILAHLKGLVNSKYKHFAGQINFSANFPF